MSISRVTPEPCDSGLCWELDNQEFLDVYDENRQTLRFMEQVRVVVEHFVRCLEAFNESQRRLDEADGVTSAAPEP